jgi:predicted amidohydrolase YtcJ
VEEAVRAYTWGAAYASFEEGIKGTVEVGKLADLAVLDADIFGIDPVEIEKARVAVTVFDGRVVYQR